MNRKGRVVAVVDDDPRVLESLDDLLQSAGYEVRCFSSPVLLIDSGFLDVDALITDISMPGLDGFELRDLVKSTQPALPVFLITGRHEIADQHRALGISGFFRKPFDGKALLASVDDALNRGEEGEDGHDHF